LLIFGFLIFRLNPLLGSYDFIFSLSLDSLNLFVFLSSLILLSALTFVLFAILAADWRLILPVAILASILPILFLPSSLAIFLTAGILISLLIIYFTLDKTLRTYITFDPFPLFGPSIRNLSFLLILVFSLGYYLSINPIIQQQGFQIPETLLESALKFIPKNQLQESKTQPQIQITKEQIELLKQNPEALRQYGLDPAILDTLDQTANKAATPAQLTDEFLKQTVKSQLNQLIQPYIDYLPIALALLFFITFQTISAFLNIFIYPLLWMIFYILEKSGFIKFTVEQRPVKKMVV